MTNIKPISLQHHQSGDTMISTRSISLKHH